MNLKNRRNWLALVLCVASLSLAAQRYDTISVRAQRLEVTRALDRLVPQCLDSLLRPYRAGVDSLRSPVLGESAVQMAAGRPESLLSNWMSDVLRRHSRAYGGKEASIGLCNVGGLRSSMPKGCVTVDDVFEIAPFENRFCLLQLRGGDLLVLFRQIAHSGGEGISGAQLDISADGLLLHATVGGKPVKEDKLYTIATIDYLAEGNDGLVALKQAVKCERKEELVRDVLMDFIKEEHAAGRAISSRLEGRITVDGRRADAGGVHTQPASRKASLFIVHTNDTHSQIEPVNPLSSNRERADKAGYLRRAGLIDMLRDDHPDLLLVDCGDFSQGSAYYNLYKGEVEVRLMNAMGYDAATIGNHEFDFGLENMARIFRMARFPILCCNYDFDSTPLSGLVKPATVIERGGLRIGLLGVCPRLEGLVQTANYEGVNYLDPVARAQAVADSLRQQEHCDLVIALSHLGWDAGLSDDMCDQRFIAATRGIDLVIGGHSHTYFEQPRYVGNADGQPVPCNQMGKSGQWVGTLTLDLEGKAGRTDGGASR